MSSLSRSTVCPGSSDPFYLVSYYIKWVTTFWTHGILGIVISTSWGRNFRFGLVTGDSTQDGRGGIVVLCVQEVVTHLI